VDASKVPGDLLAEVSRPRGRCVPVDDNLSRSDDEGYVMDIEDKN